MISFFVTDHHVVKCPDTWDDTASSYAAEQLTRLEDELSVEFERRVSQINASLRVERRGLNCAIDTIEELDS